MKKLGILLLFLFAGVVTAQQLSPAVLWGSVFNTVLPNLTSFQTVVWQGFSNGYLRVTGLVAAPQFLLLVPGAGNNVLQTNGVAKICLAGTC